MEAEAVIVLYLILHYPSLVYLSCQQRYHHTLFIVRSGTWNSHSRMARLWSSRSPWFQETENSTGMTMHKTTVLWGYNAVI